MHQLVDLNEADTKIAFIWNNAKFELDDGADHAF
jgi:hypothetical protein